MSAAAVDKPAAGQEVGPAGGVEETQTPEERVAELEKKNKDLTDKLVKARQREHELIVQLTTKETTIYTLESHLKRLVSDEGQRHVNMRATFMDPTINDNFKYLNEQLADSKKKLKTAQEDLAAMAFNPNQDLGKKLMQKCRALQEENEALGKEMSEGNHEKMRLELQLTKKSLKELSEESAESVQYIEMLDSENKEMQDQVFKLENELRFYKSATPMAKRTFGLEPDPAESSEQKGEEEGKASEANASSKNTDAEGGAAAMTDV